jgi:DNA-binding HxlR family transcriptional regulator
MSSKPVFNELASIGAGLAGRMRSLVIALDRLDRLESGSGEWLDGFAVAELDESATTMTLRMLRTVSDLATYTILQKLETADSHFIPTLMVETGLGRLVLSEQLNDLVQVGLVTRLIDTDHVQITTSGAALVQLVGAIVQETAVAFRS